MTGILAMRSEIMNVEFALPDTDSAAEAALAAALRFCAQKMQLRSPDEALERLRRGDRSAAGYFEYGLAQHVAEHLAALDDEVQVVYLYDYEATPEDAIFGEERPLLVHLIVVVQRKTGALNSLVAALDRALAQSYAGLLGKPKLAHLLDVQLVDQAEVNTRSGYGALLSSLHHRPLRLWKRQPL